MNCDAGRFLRGPIVALLLFAAACDSGEAERKRLAAELDRERAARVALEAQVRSESKPAEPPEKVRASEPASSAPAPAPVAPPAPPAPPRTPEIEKKVVRGGLSESVHGWLLVSPDGEVAAYDIRRGGKAIVVCGTQESSPYDSVISLQFVPGTRDVAYIGVEGDLDRPKRSVLWIGSREVRRLDSMLASELTFSRDGKTWAYAVARKYKSKDEFAWRTERWVVVGDREGKRHDGVEYLTFTPDGTTLCYQAGRDEQIGKRTYQMRRLIVGDREGKEVLLSGRPVFSADGKTVVYRAYDTDRGHFVMVGDKAGEVHENDIGDPVISSDGRTVAYAFKKEKGWALKVGREEGDEYAEIEHPVFSPDGKTVAYVGDVTGEWIRVAGGRSTFFKREGFVVVVGKSEGKVYKEIIGPPVFSPDGSRVAYQVATSPDDSKARRERIVIGTAEGPPFTCCSAPLFLDANTVRYFAEEGSSLVQVTVKLP